MDTPSFQPEELVEHESALRALALDILRDDHGADDIVQETFRLAVERGSEGVRSPASWLARIARNLALNARRAQRHRRQREEWNARQESVRGADREGVGEALATAVDGLREPYRTAIRLRYFEELSVHAVADSLEVSRNTAKTRLRRGLEQLRDSLDREHGGRARWTASLLLFLGLTPDAVDARPAGRSSVAWVIAVVGLATIGLWLQSGATAPSPVAEGPPESSERPLAAAPDEPVRSATRAAAPNSATAAPIASPASPAEGALRLAVTWSDGRPASDVRFSFHPDATWPRGVRTAVTDARGELVIALPEGAVEVASDRGQRWASSVAAGRTLTVPLRLRAGLRVTGTVVDEREDPVPHAGIWLTAPRTDWLGGRVAARTDAHGRFQLLGVDPGMSIGAVAPGRAPADLVDLDTLGSNDARVDVLLSLHRAGAALHGVVRTTDGAPVPGARVAAGAWTPLVQKRADGSTIDLYSPRVAIADEGGAFRFEGLEPGVVPLFVEDERGVRSVSEVELRPGEETVLHAVLAEPRTVAGVARDEGGRPVTGVLVGALAPEHAAYTHPATAPPPTPFAPPLARTDAAGRFRIEGVPRGEVRLVAWDEAGLRGASIAIDVEAIETPWDPVLGTGLSIGGRVLDAADEPLDWTVRARPLDGSYDARLAEPRADGRFALVGLRDTEYELLLERERSLVGNAQAIRVRARPGDTDVVLRPAERRERMPGRVVGTLVDAGARCSDADAADVLLFAREGVAGYLATRAGAEFAFDAVAPGQHRVAVREGLALVHIGDWFEVNESGFVDLGEVVTSAAAELRVSLELPPGVNSAGLRAFLESKRIEVQVPLALRGDLFVGEDLLDGDHALWIVGDGIAHVMRDVTLAPGEALELEVACARGTERFFELTGPAGQPWQGLQIELTTPEGSPVIDFWHPWATSDAPAIWSFRLAPGEFLVRATTRTGLEASERVAYPTLAPEAEPVRMRLSSIRDR